MAEKKEQAESYSQANIPSLVFRKEGGAEEAWDRSLLGRRSFKPQVMFGEETYEMLTLRFLGDAVRIYGENLAIIVASLAKGNGGEITEQAPRYRSTAPKDKTFVAKIEFDLEDDD